MKVWGVKSLTALMLPLFYGNILKRLIHLLPPYKRLHIAIIFLYLYVLQSRTPTNFLPMRYNNYLCNANKIYDMFAKKKLQFVLKIEKLTIDI